MAANSAQKKHFDSKQNLAGRVATNEPFPKQKKQKSGSVNPDLIGTEAANEPTSKQNERIKTNDRSYLNSSTRNVRSSYMPGAAKPLNTGHQSTDKQFVDFYSKKGLQPQQLGGAAEPQSRLSKQQNKNVRVEKSVRTPQPTRRRLRLRKKNKRSVVGKGIAYAKVTTLNIGIISWNMFFWSTFQIWIGVVSLAFLGLAGVWDTVVDFIRPSQDKGFYATTFDTLGNATDAVTYAVSELVEYTIGFDLGNIVPLNLFLVTHAVILLTGFLSLFTIFLIYKAALLKPLSGEGSGLKIGMFLLALIGYATPFINLLPMFLPWVLAVWRYPK